MSKSKESLADLATATLIEMIESNDKLLASFRLAKVVKANNQILDLLDTRGTKMAESFLDKRQAAIEAAEEAIAQAKWDAIEAAEDAADDLEAARLLALEAA